MAEQTELQEHERRITKLETCVDDITKAVSSIQGSQNTTLTLIKWVILPLIVIVGGLVGVKIALPTV